MLIGAHSIIYSTNPEADRALFRDGFRLTHVDVGDGWLIFGLPPAELAVHPAEARLGISQPRHARPQPMVQEHTT